MFHLGPFCILHWQVEKKPPYWHPEPPSRSTTTAVLDAASGKGSPWAGRMHRALWASWALFSTCLFLTKQVSLTESRWLFFAYLWSESFHMKKITPKYKKNKNPIEGPTGRLFCKLLTVTDSKTSQYINILLHTKIGHNFFFLDDTE